MRFRLRCPMRQQRHGITYNFQSGGWTTGTFDNIFLRQSYASCSTLIQWNGTSCTAVCKGMEISGSSWACNMIVYRYQEYPPIRLPVSGPSLHGTMSGSWPSSSGGFCLSWLYRRCSLFRLLSSSCLPLHPCFPHRWNWQFLCLCPFQCLCPFSPSSTESWVLLIIRSSTRCANGVSLVHGWERERERERD